MLSSVVRRVCGNSDLLSEKQCTLSIVLYNEVYDNGLKIDAFSLFLKISRFVTE